VMSDGFVEWVFMIPSRMRATLGGDAREEQRIAATVYAGQIALFGAWAELDEGFASVLESSLVRERREPGAQGEIGAVGADLAKYADSVPLSGSQSTNLAGRADLDTFAIWPPPTDSEIAKGPTGPLRRREQPPISSPRCRLWPGETSSVLRAPPTSRPGVP